MSTSPTRPARYVFIDALRGLTALSVVIFHARGGGHIDTWAATWPAFVDGIVYNMGIAVQIFFVLSGFVIAHSMIRHDVGFGYVGRFLLRRSIRLDPPYWASMAMTIALAVVSTRFVAGKVYEFPSLSNLGLHVLYLADLLHYPMIQPVYWTLCLEIQFYLVFAVLMMVATVLRRWTSPERAFYIVLLPCLVFADLWPLGRPPFSNPELFPEQWYQFLSGVAVYWAVSRPGDLRAATLAFGNAALLGVIAAVRQDVAVAMGAAAALLILLAGIRGTLTTWLGSRPFLFLGTISYSLYLIHNPLSGAMYRVGYRISGRSLALEAFWFVAVLVGCVALSALFCWAVEKPSLAFSRRIRVGPAEAPSAVPAELPGQSRS
ncbi:MAG TPA: acyltransferase [Planctomycetota bacterium]|jgi:peptidoglycan/LPS O-acetylase OafA/YrhL|nr:acyltransferase [Planctomycetota bacterium]